MGSLTAERAVLGAVLRDNAAFAAVAAILTEDDFRADASRRVWRAMADLLGAGKPVDAALLADALHERGEVADVGGYAYLGELWDAAPTAANAEYYARVVRDHATRWRLFVAAAEIAREAKRPSGPVEELLAQAEAKILAIARVGSAGQVVTGVELMRGVCERYDQRQALGGRCPGLPSGLVDLDNLTGGFQPGELCVLAARPSVGKTSLSACVARHAALEARVPVFFVTLEQSRDELGDKLACIETGIDSAKLRRAALKNGEDRLLTEAARRIGQARLFFDDVAGQTATRVAANARRLRAREGIGLVVIDYLQLVEPDSRKPPRHEQVAAISRRFKLLARELRVPVITVAQLNRAPETDKRRPRLSDLRESGSIEADADLVLLLHRPEPDPLLAEGPVSNVEVIVAKNRNGKTGQTALSFRRSCQRFENYAPEFMA